MQTLPAQIAPISLPPAHQPTRMPSLPAWLVSRVNAVKVNSQPTDEGPHRSVLTLPQALIPSQAQRQAIVEHMQKLESFLKLTAEDDDRANTETMIAITKLL